ncbi:MAG: PAS domain S-box protein, partial [Solirubrobacteraceae bacterium]
MDRPSDSAARAGEREPVRAGEAAAPLRGLLELSRLTRSHPSPLDTLRAVAQTVSEALRFRTVAVNAFRPETDDYEVVAVHGNERARETLLGDVTPTATWEPLLDARFLRHGVYLVPAGEINYDPSVRWYVPELPGSPATRSELDWHEDDALFAPLDGAAGLRFGIISLDEPITGLRPTDAELEVLSALAAHAALAVESSLQLTALEAALARNRALIQSTLDCVIAVDESIRVIEFNPAAERAFGRHSADVLGRDAAELLVAPALREVFRSFARRARENPDSTILGRRIETSALRGDGSEFPVEVTVTRVPGGVGEGPFFYAFLRDIAERRRSEEQLSYLAYHDALTDLPNRTLVEREM